MKKLFAGILIAALVASGYSYKAAIYSGGDNFNRVDISKELKQAPIKLYEKVSHPGDPVLPCRCLLAGDIR